MFAACPGEARHWPIVAALVLLPAAAFSARAPCAAPGEKPEGSRGSRRAMSFECCWASRCMSAQSDFACACVVVINATRVAAREIRTRLMGHIPLVRAKSATGHDECNQSLV